MSLSGIRYGQRNLQKGENDIQAKIRLCNHIRRTYNNIPFRDRYLVFNEGRLQRISETIEKGIDRSKTIRNPDIIVFCQVGLVIVELDGDVHRVHGVDTAERNSLYKGAGIKYIVLNTKDFIKEFDDKFTAILQNKGVWTPELA